jgi:hypothetical protein
MVTPAVDTLNYFIVTAFKSIATAVTVGFVVIAAILRFR